MEYIFSVTIINLILVLVLGIISRYRGKGMIMA
jgi:hypothetical protein